MKKLYKIKSKKRKSFICFLAKYRIVPNNPDIIANVLGLKSGIEVTNLYRELKREGIAEKINLSGIERNGRDAIVLTKFGKKLAEYNEIKVENFPSNTKTKIRLLNKNKTELFLFKSSENGYNVIFRNPLYNFLKVNNWDVNIFKNTRVQAFLISKEKGNLIPLFVANRNIELNTNAEYALKKLVCESTNIDSSKCNNKIILIDSVCALEKILFSEFDYNRLNRRTDNLKPIWDKADYFNNQSTYFLLNKPEQIKQIKKIEHDYSETYDKEINFLSFYFESKAQKCEISKEIFGYAFFETKKDILLSLITQEKRDFNRIKSFLEKIESGEIKTNKNIYIVTSDSEFAEMYKRHINVDFKTIILNC